MWTVYKPAPGQKSHHAREVHITQDGPEPTGLEAIGPLDLIREHFAGQGFTCISRSPEDHHSVVESWLE